MSNKDLLKQAIAEAKTIREAAIANAKEALEETLTPHLKEMLAQKLQEMEDADDMDESTINQAGFEDYSEDPKKHGNIGDINEEEEEEEAPEEEAEETEEGEEEEELEIEDMSVEDLKDLIRDIVAQETGHDEEAEMETGEEGPEEEDMVSMDDSEEIDINELLAELEGMDETHGYTGGTKEIPGKGTHSYSKTAGSKRSDVKGVKGDGYMQEGEVDEYTSAPTDRGTSHKDTGKELDTQMVNAIKSIAAKTGKSFDAISNFLYGGKSAGTKEMGSFEEGVELDEYTSAPTDRGTSHKNTGKELDTQMVNAIKSIAGKTGKSFEAISQFLYGGKKATPAEFEESVQQDLQEALKAVKILRNQLQEVNLLNAKLLYVNKVFKSNNLSEGQKVNVIAAFDKAETVKEVKLVFETVSKNVVAKPATIKEHRSFASKATGNANTTAPKEILSEVSEQVARWQKLAGIIKS